MMKLTLAASVVLLAAPALAQDSGEKAASATMGQLASQGYEIKAAVPNGSKFIVFLQKEKSAYACEFASLANSRCGSIN